MAVHTIGASGMTSAISVAAQVRPAVAPVGRASPAAALTSSAAATIVVSKVVHTRADGSVTTVITYADGHTEAETTPGSRRNAAQSVASRSGGAPAPAADGSTSVTAVDTARGRVDLLV